MSMAATETRLPAIDIVVESGPWDGKDEDAARRALEQTAVVVGRNFKGQALSVLFTDDAAYYTAPSRAPCGCW